MITSYNEYIRKYEQLIKQIQELNYKLHLLEIEFLNFNLLKLKNELKSK